MGKTVTVDYDQLVSLLQTFYDQGFDDAVHSPIPFDMKDAAEHQINLLIPAEYEAAFDKLAEDIKSQPQPQEIIDEHFDYGDDEAQDYDTFGDRKI